jgi:hypothetical protein
MARRMSEMITVVAAAFFLAAQPASAQGASGGQQEPPAQGGAGIGGGMQGGGGMAGKGMQGNGVRQGMSSERQVQGKVASVDAGQKEITLVNGQKLQLTSEAKVLEGRKQSSLGAIKPGDHVRASLDAQGQVQHVVVMHAGSRPAPSPTRQQLHAPGTGQTPGQTPPAAPQSATPGEPAPAAPQR